MPVLIGRIRLRWPYLILIVAAVVVLVDVLYLTRYKDFYFDEWDFIISRRSWSLNVFILPRFYYMSAVPILVWKVLFATIGLRSYVPYEAVLLGFDIAAAVLLFILVRRRSGDVPALAASVMLLFFGAGSYNIIFAFQICYVGAIAFGLLAMLLANATSRFAIRVSSISLALVCGLMCEVVTLAFVAALFVELGLDSRRRRLMVSLVPPVVLFGIWYVIFDTGSYPGTPGVSTELLRGPTGLRLIPNLLAFVISGVSGTVAGIFGLPLEAGIAVLIGLLALWVWAFALRRARIQSWQLGMVAGLVAFFVLTGFGRLQFGINYATQTRYIYAGAIFVLPLLAHGLASIPWRGILSPAVAVLYGAALFANILQLQAAATSQVEFMAIENAELQTVEYYRHSLDMNMADLIDARTMWALHAGEYLAARDELGSPVPELGMSGVTQLPSWAVDRVMVNLFGDRLKASATGPERSGSTCRDVAVGSASTLRFQVADNDEIMLQPTSSGYVDLALSLLNKPEPQALRRIHLDSKETLGLHVPSTSPAAMWQLWVRSQDLQSLHICGDTVPRVTPLSEYDDLAATFVPGTGWSYVPDATAATHWAAQASAGTAGPEGAFGDAFTPMPGQYDLWYRVRVADHSSRSPQMVVAVVDLDANRYVASTTLSPNQVDTRYSWVLVASQVTPATGHQMRFQTNIASTLSTDWYVDRAVMVPAGSGSPQD